MASEFLSAHIIEKDSAFCSRSFLIRFVTDKVYLNDIGFFRMELQSKVKKKSEEEDTEEDSNDEDEDGEEPKIYL